MSGNVPAPYRDSRRISWGFIITDQFIEINKVNHAFNMSKGVGIFRAYGIICLRRPDSFFIDIWFESPAVVLCIH